MYYPYRPIYKGGYAIKKLGVKGAPLSLSDLLRVGIGFYGHFAQGTQLLLEKVAGPYLWKNIPGLMFVGYYNHRLL